MTPGALGRCVRNAVFSSLQVNELDGIPLILDSCSPDDSNPCILACEPPRQAAAHASACPPPPPAALLLRSCLLPVGLFLRRRPLLRGGRPVPWPPVQVGLGSRVAGMLQGERCGGTEFSFWQVLFCDPLCLKLRHWLSSSPVIRVCSGGAGTRVPKEWH